jgi:hypothetical protein
MKPKNQKKIPARRHRLLLRFLKTLEQTRRGSVSTSLFHRVPLLRGLRLMKPLFKKKMMNFSTSWHREFFFEFYDFFVFVLFLLGCKKPSFFLLSVMMRSRKGMLHLPLLLNM